MLNISVLFMRKIAFIQINNILAPIEAENEYVMLDCQQINDFCSFVGDALVGDLKDDNGIPIYRLLNSMGRLLSDFEAVEKECFNSIISQWWDMIGEMLHEGLTQCDKRFVICFPRLYVDWLINNGNEYYTEIGKNLLLNHGRVCLDAYGISEDIVSALHMKINRFLNEQKEKIEYVVFSDKRIGNSSNIIKQLRNIFDNYSFLRYEQWEHILTEEKQRKIENLEDYRAFWLDDLNLKIGVTDKEDIPEKVIGETIWYKGFYLEFKKNGKLSRIATSFTNDNAKNTFLSIIYGKSVKWDLSYNQVAAFLISKKSFYESLVPCKKFDRDEFIYEGILCKKTETFCCLVRFFSYAKYNKDIFDFKERKYTLHEIDVRLE